MLEMIINLINSLVSFFSNNNQEPVEDVTYLPTFSQLGMTIANRFYTWQDGELVYTFEDRLVWDNFMEEKFNRFWEEGPEPKSSTFSMFYVAPECIDPLLKTMMTMTIINPSSKTRQELGPEVVDQMRVVALDLPLPFAKTGTMK